METKQILTANVLDILFEGKNKAYGAYDLRKSYHKRITYALLGTGACCLLLIAGTIFAKSKDSNDALLVSNEVVLEKIIEEEKKIEPPKPLPKVEQVIEMVRVTPPLIVPDIEVREEDEVKEIAEIEDVKIGNVDQEGIREDVVSPPVEQTTDRTVVLKDELDYEREITVVQIAASFPGGQANWVKFLERNLNSNVPVDAGAPMGKYTVIVSFIVDKQGNVSEVRAENDPGHGTKEEAIRVIQKGPKWNPAIQNGRQVIYRHKQSITFEVSEQ